MTKREENLMEVMATIEQLGYTSCYFSVMKTEGRACDIYPSKNATQVLPPHIGVWVNDDDRATWINTGKWDDAIETDDGDLVAIYFFSDNN